MMNRRGEMNLTYLFMGIVLFVGVITLLFTAYNTFLVDNSQTMDSAIAASYQDIINQTTAINLDSDDMKSQSKTLLQDLSKLPQYLFISLTIGFDIITSFLDLPIYIKSFADSISDVLPIPSALIWIFLTVGTIYIISLVVKAVRGGEQA